MLGGLDGRGEDTRSTEEIGYDEALVVLAGEFDGAARWDVAVEQSVREYDDVRREAIAADVAAFPGARRVRRSERLGDRATSHGATRVVTPVRADEVDRLGADRACNLAGKHVEQVLIRRQRPPTNFFTPRPT